MPVYFITGKLGAGKTLASVGRIRDYLYKGLPIATNLDLDLVNLLGPNKKNTIVYRLPDKPKVEDLHNIGKGNTTYDESKNGLLVLDECGTWFNSRSWNDKSRQPIIDWFLHARKYGWDIAFIVQDISIVDKQAREALAEHVVYCRRLDRMRIPYISAIVKLLTGINLTGPKVHIGIVKYGDQLNSLVIDRWWYRAIDLYNAYDTKQVFKQSEDGVYQLLPSWYSCGRYQPVKNFDWWKRKIRKHILRRPWYALLAASLLAAPVASYVTVYFTNINIKQNKNHQFTNENPSQQSEKTIKTKKPEPPSWILSLRINGFVVFSGETTYFIEEANNGISYSSADLKDMGYSIIPQTKCRFELVGVGWSHAVTCRNKMARDSAPIGAEGT